MHGIYFKKLDVPISLSLSLSLSKQSPANQDHVMQKHAE